MKYNLIYLSVVLSVTISLLSCSNDNKSPISREEANKAKIESIVEELESISGYDSLGLEYHLQDDYMIRFDSTLIEVRRNFEKNNLVEIKLDIYPENDTIKFEIRNQIIHWLTGEPGDSCTENFCSWYNKSTKDTDVEILLFDESTTRGFPYIAFRILEKDGIGS